MHRFALGTSLLLALQTGAVCAAPPSGSSPAEVERTGALTTPENNPRAGIVNGSSIGLLASDDGTQVMLTLAPKVQNLLTTNGQSQWSLTLSAPLDKKSGRGDFATEHGLNDQFGAEFSFNRIFAGLGDSTAAEEAVVAHYFKTCDKKCWHGDLANAPAEFVENLTADEVATLRKAEIARAKKQIWVLGASASLGYGRFSFLSDTDFAKNRRNKLSYGFSISGGVNPSRGAAFFGGGYEYRVDYSAADKRVVCLPNASPPPPTKCQYDHFDVPQKEVSHDVFGLIRIADLFQSQRTDARFRLPIALEIRAGYDFHNKIASVTVPTYFLMNGDGNFRGGVKFSWANRTIESRADDFRVSLFVAKSFDFFAR